MAGYCGLRFGQYFSKGNEIRDIYPSKTIDAVVKEGGKVVETIRDVEALEHWIPSSVDVAATKYFRKTDVPDEFGGRNGKEVSVYRLVDRVAQTIAKWGAEDGYFNQEEGDKFRKELAFLCAGQYGSFNSPVYFNLGLKDVYGIYHEETDLFTQDRKTGEIVRTEDSYSNPLLSACYIVSPGDSIESMMDVAAMQSSRLFKYGAGIGSGWSDIRGAGEPISGGGVASGPERFRDIQDSSARVIKSGGKTRRAAVLNCLSIYHPDIVEFVTHKNLNEMRARVLMDSGASRDWRSSTVQDMRGQNVNDSVRVDKAFLDKVRKDEDHSLIAVKSGKPFGKPIRARNLLKLVAYSAHQCGDPGVQYDDTINAWHTCPNSGRINASNPCSEFMFVDNSACNLASLNLLKFLNEDGSFDVKSYKKAVDIFSTAQEIVVSRAAYPSEAIARNSNDFRPIGLGYANLGATCMVMGMPYDSDHARNFAAAVTSITTAEAYLQSSTVARVKGVFARYNENREPMLKVIKKHREHSKKLNAVNGLEDLVKESERLWDAALASGEKYGYRNSQTTLLAPTGTTGFLMGCDTMGIEPDLALIKVKSLAGGGNMKIVNQSIPRALRRRGYNEDTIEAISTYILENGNIETCELLNSRDLPIFDCANACGGGERYIDPMGHIKMMAAVQPFLSGAISKTVNLSGHTSVEDIMDLYLVGHDLGLKSLSIYRDGSKTDQPVGVMRMKAPTLALTRSQKEPLPPIRVSRTFGYKVGQTKMYVTTGEYPPDPKTGRIRLGELFVNCLGRGTDFDQMMNGLAISTSNGLQHGVPLDEAISAFDKVGKSDTFKGLCNHPYIKTVGGLTEFVYKLVMSQYGGDISFVSKGEGKEMRPLPAELRVYDAMPPLHLIPTVGGFQPYPDVPSLEDTIELISGQNYWLDGEDEETRQTMDKILKTRTWGVDPSVFGIEGVITGETCPDCGGMLTRNGPCKSCPSCQTIDGTCGG